MLKKAAAIVTVIFLMGQFFFQLGLLAWFSINRAEIAAEHCINKSLPKSCCFGKCYISNQLTDMEDDAGEEKHITENDLPVFIVSEVLQFYGLHTGCPANKAGNSSGLPLSYLTVEYRPPETGLI